MGIRHNFVWINGWAVSWLIAFSTLLLIFPIVRNVKRGVEIMRFFFDCVIGYMPHHTGYNPMKFSLNSIEATDHRAKRESNR
ncbi:MAG: DUF2798 domain-containing protein [Deltaproteobacteria bacterium]|nr:DUF2798 domain-containing protein [Deltaproteobacteria bacterium]